MNADTILNTNTSLGVRFLVLPSLRVSRSVVHTENMSHKDSLVFRMRTHQSGTLHFGVWPNNISFSAREVSVNTGRKQNTIQQQDIT
jgi:hypothetical protein